MKKNLPILFLCLFILQQNIHASCSGTVTYTAPSGTFDDGSGPLNNYDNLSNCFFLISPGAGFSNITLSFNDFFTEDFFDFVYVYDGPTTASPLLGTFNGNVLPPNLTSTGNQILIRFTSDNSVPKAGWSVNYDAHYCSGTTTFNTQTGSFSDGSGANNYGNYSECSYFIAPGAAFTNITLSFSSFDIENNFDFVKIYDGSTTASPLLATYTGNTLPPSINSTSNQMLVVFTSNASNTSPGWDANYVANIYCGGTTTLTSPTGSFSDGSGVNDYVLNSNCSWLISPSGTFITIALSFSSFNTEEGVDFVRVYDGSTTGSPLIGAFSGNALPVTVHSTGTQMLVVFTSDADIQGQGWNASYITNCTPQVTISGSSTICPNESPDLNAVVVNGGSTPFYQWKVNGTNAGINSTSFSPVGLIDGDVVSVDMTSNANCAYPLLASNSVTIHINSPSVGINASSTSVCNGQGVTLSGTGASTYSWNNGVTDGVEFIPPLGNTTYVVTGTDGNGCSATASIEIIVHATPTPVITSNTGSFIFCNCDRITLNAGTYSNYFWSTGAITRTIRVNSASTFTVTVTNSFGCTGSASATTIVNYGKPSKPADISGPVNGLCSTSGNVYSIAPVPSAIYYEWCTTSGIITSGQNTTSITVDFGNFSSATISVKAVNKCGKSNARELIVNAKPMKPLSIDGISKGVCKQNGITYSVNPVPGADYYKWIVPQGVLLLNGQGTTSIIVKFLNSFSSSGIISVKAQNNCGSSDYAQLKVYADPQKPSDIIGPAGICQYQSNVSYSTLPVFGALSYSWTVPTNATIVSGQGTTSIVVNFGSNSGDIKVKARNNCGFGPSRELDVSLICREANNVTEKCLVYPNPVHEFLNMNITAQQNQNCSIRLLDMLGNQLMSNSYNLVEGNNQYSFDVSLFPKGIYLLLIERHGLMSEKVRIILE